MYVSPLASSYSFSSARASPAPSLFTFPRRRRIFRFHKILSENIFNRACFSPTVPPSRFPSWTAPGSCDESLVGSRDRRDERSEHPGRETWPVARFESSHVARGSGGEGGKICNGPARRTMSYFRESSRLKKRRNAGHAKVSVSERGNASRANNDARRRVNKNQGSANARRKEKKH